MAFLRKFARPLVALPLALDGLDAVTRPETHVDLVRPWAKKAEKYGAPSLLDNDLVTLTRATGVVTLGAAAAFSLSRKPRLMAGILALLALPIAVIRHPFWEKDTRAEQQAEATNFAKQISAIMAVLLISQGKRKKRK